MVRLALFCAAVLCMGLITPIQAEDRPDYTAGAETAQKDEPYLTAAQKQRRKNFERIGIDERLGEVVDLDVPFLDMSGRAVSLRDYVRGDLPVALVYVYHDCPMLCSMVLDGLTRTVRETNLTLGKDYRIVAISIDPRDSPDDAAAAHDRYASLVEASGDTNDFVFLTGSQEAITTITDATGFRYEWQEDRQEYAHTAAVLFISPGGAITRYLYGLQPSPADFRRAMLEAGEGTIGSTLDQLLLYCFVYDPAAGGYILHATNAMKLGGAVTLLFLVAGLFVFWRREQRSNTAHRLGRLGWGEGEDALRIEPTS